MELFNSLLIAFLLLIWAGADILFASGKGFQSRLLFFLTLVIISGSIYWMLTWL